PPRRPRAVPFDAPAALLSAPVVRLFNTAYFRRIPRQGRVRRRALAQFFFPLDALGSWNRLYGKAGFHQFQCVLPETTAAATLRQMLTRIADARRASPLAVLKRLGPGRAGPLSFPMPGYTLAVDLPNRPGVSDLIEGLCRMTAAAGGRVYLAKDTLCPPDLIGDMYPEAAAFAALLRKVDPQGMFETDLARRLSLRQL
ncbi:MAG: FAD-binding oxidoreductase, partial [Pseudomonadota bacterium]